MAQAEILMMGPMLPLVMEELGRRFVVHRLWELADEGAFLAANAGRIRGIAAAVSRAPVRASLIDALPALEIVANFGVGYENVDVDAAARRGVVVTNTPDVLTEEVADLTIGLVIATVRRIPEADRYLREGRWLAAPFALTGTLRGRTVGILGLGRIGRAVATRLEAFGVAIAYCGRNRQPDMAYAYHPDAVSLAKASDILIVVTPGGTETRGLVDRSVLEALGRDGVLINVGRGTVVDEPALIAALNDGTIAAAGLDVFADEPRVPEALIACPNTVLLPHVASASQYTRNAMGQLVVDNLVAWFEGRGPVTPVTETPVPAR